MGKAPARAPPLPRVPLSNPGGAWWVASAASSQDPCPARRSPPPPFPVPCGALIPSPGHLCQTDLLLNFSVHTGGRGEGSVCSVQLPGRAPSAVRKESCPQVPAEPTSVPTICNDPFSIPLLLPPLTRALHLPGKLYQNKSGKRW